MTPAMNERWASVDHILSVSRGGTNKLENLVCACWSCNREKNDSDDAIWMEKLRTISPRSRGGWDGFLSILLKLEPESEWARIAAQLFSNEIKSAG